MIRKLYYEILEEGNKEQMEEDEKLRHEIEAFLEERAIKITSEKEDGGDAAFSLAAIGKEYGFELGFKYAIRLLTECWK